MSGVVHEAYDGMKRIHCKVKFCNYPPEDELIGRCFVTHILQDEKKNREKCKLVLEVSIWNVSGEWREKSYNAVRDAAISGNQFLHLRIEKETIEKAVALAEIREHDYGPTLKVREFVMWSTITLPKAPDWAWKEQ